MTVKVKMTEDELRQKLIDSGSVCYKWKKLIRRLPVQRLWEEMLEEGQIVYLLPYLEDPHDLVLDLIKKMGFITHYARLLLDNQKWVDNCWMVDVAYVSFAIREYPTPIMQLLCASRQYAFHTGMLSLLLEEHMKECPLEFA